MAHPKGVLIERMQQDGKQPRFETETRGPDHAPEFHTEVSVDGTILGRGQGGTKRTAERRAAEEALAGLDKAEKAPASKSTRRSKAKKTAGAKKEEPAAKDEARPAAKSSASAAKSRPRKSKSGAKRTSDAPTPKPADAPFDGPWPVFEDLLAQSLQVAHQRTSSELRGDEAREAVQAFALRLYKDLLLDLGDVVEEDDSNDAEPR